MKRIVLAAMALSLFTVSVALADPPQSYDQGHDRHDQRADHHHVAHHAAFNSGRYVRPHGYHAHTWRRGERLPVAYRGAGYVIPNPAVYHLRPAPRGYYWVRVDNNAVLAAVATGVVASVALNLFH